MFSNSIPLQAEKLAVGAVAASGWEVIAEVRAQQCKW